VKVHVKRLKKSPGCTLGKFVPCDLPRFLLTIHICLESPKLASLQFAEIQMKIGPLLSMGQLFEVNLQCSTPFPEDMFLGVLKLVINCIIDICLRVEGGVEDV